MQTRRFQKWLAALWTSKSKMELLSPLKLKLTFEISLKAMKKKSQKEVLRKNLQSWKIGSRTRILKISKEQF